MNAIDSRLEFVFLNKEDTFSIELNPDLIWFKDELVTALNRYQAVSSDRNSIKETTKLLFLGNQDADIIELDINIHQLKEEIKHLIRQHGEFKIRSELYRYCRTPPFVIEKGGEIVFVGE